MSLREPWFNFIPYSSGKIKLQRDESILFLKNSLQKSAKKERLWTLRLHVNVGILREMDFVNFARKEENY